MKLVPDVARIYNPEHHFTESSKTDYSMSIAEDLTLREYDHISVDIDRSGWASSPRDTDRMTEDHLILRS